MLAPTDASSSDARASRSSGARSAHVTPTPSCPLKRTRPVGNVPSPSASVIHMSAGVVSASSRNWPRCRARARRPAPLRRGAKHPADTLKESCRRAVKWSAPGCEPRSSRNCLSSGDRAGAPRSRQRRRVHGTNRPGRREPIPARASMPRRSRVRSRTATCSTSSSRAATAAALSSSSSSSAPARACWPIAASADCWLARSRTGLAGFADGVALQARLQPQDGLRVEL